MTEALNPAAADSDAFALRVGYALNEYRIELACRLLKQQKDSVAEICYQAGFNNVPYFNRVFKKLKGVAPSEYAALPPH